MSTITMIHGDCIAFMAACEDNAFELAIVDPPYGIGEDWKKRNKGHKYKETSYKNEPVDARYFEELLRVSKDQIIWGWNYYTHFLGTTNYLIVWDKQSSNNNVFKYSQCEIAFTSKRIPCRLVSIPWDGYRMGKETGQKKIHPHQKPIALYKWLLGNYAKPDDRIIDTHGGSGSSVIACIDKGFDKGFDMVWIEKDADYYAAAVLRVERFNSQQDLFRGQAEIEQTSTKTQNSP